MWQLLESIILQPFFVALNLVLLVWILIKFHRRYSGRHPLAFATGIYLFPFIPFIPWLLAFRLFTAHTNLANREQRRLNRIGVKFGGLLFLAVLSLIIALAVIAGSIWVSRDGMVTVTLIVALFGLLALISVGAAVSSAIKFTSEIRIAEQGIAPQSATRSESKSEGGDKPQPESKPRPR